MKRLLILACAALLLTLAVPRVPLPHDAGEQFTTPSCKLLLSIDLNRVCVGDTISGAAEAVGQGGFDASEVEVVVTLPDGRERIGKQRVPFDYETRAADAGKRITFTARAPQCQAAPVEKLADVVVVRIVGNYPKALCEMDFTQSLEAEILPAGNPVWTIEQGGKIAELVGANTLTPVLRGLSMGWGIIRVSVADRDLRHCKASLEFVLIRVSIVDYPQLLAVSDSDKARAVIEPPNRKIKWSVKGPNGTGDKVDPVLGKETTVKSGSRPGWLTLTAMDAETEACAVSVQIPVARLTILIPHADPANPAEANSTNERAYDDWLPPDLSVECLAKLEPVDLEADIVWEIGDIGNIRAVWQPTYPTLPNRGYGESPMAYYHRLPEHNRDFGFKRVWAYLLKRPACRDERRIEAFYPPMTQNNDGPRPENPPPGIDPNGGDWNWSDWPEHAANWFFFGKDGKVVGNMDNTVGWLWGMPSDTWDPIKMSSYFLGRIGVHDAGFLAEGDHSVTVPTFLPPVILINMPGKFGSVSLCIRHESFHAWVDKTFGPLSGKYTYGGDITDPYADTDGDGLPNYVEDPSLYNWKVVAPPHPVLGDLWIYNLNPRDADTYLVGKHVKHRHGDEELLAHLLTSRSNPDYDPAKDFSEGGARWQH